MIKKILLQVVIISGAYFLLPDMLFYIIGTLYAFFWICRVLYIAIAGDGLYIKPVEED